MNECKASCGGGNAPARSLITPVKIASTFLAAAVLAVATPGSVLAAASSNEGGEYAYAGSPTDNRTTGQTGDQTYTISAPITVNNFWPGQNDSSDYWQIYKGAAITGTGTRILGLGTEGTVMTDAEFRALRRTFAAEIREGLSRRDAPCGRPLID